MMRKKIAIFLYSILGFSSLLSAQIRLGVRDNKFLGVGYTYHKTWSVKLEESIFSEDLPYQYVRGYLGCGHRWKYVGICLSPYLGTQWNGNFQDYGIQCKVEYMCNKSFALYGILDPHKDTSLGYSTCYEIGGIYNVNSDISFCLSYHNIPEYRMVSKRIRVGIIFSEKHLKVIPLLSVPTDENIKNIRFLMNFEWVFGNE